jgi:large subunit ribosomal protein L29
MMKASDLRDMTNADLGDHLKDARRELFGLRFQHATGELDNTSSLRKAKKEIARALTIAHEREIEIDGRSDAGNRHHPGRTARRTRRYRNPT